MKDGAEGYRSNEARPLGGLPTADDDPFVGLAGSEDIVDLPVGSLALSPRVQDLLRKLGVKHVGDLCDVRIGELTDHRGVGAGRIVELTAALEDAAAAVGLAASVTDTTAAVEPTSGPGAGSAELDGYVPAPWDRSTAFGDGSVVADADPAVAPLMRVAAWIAVRSPTLNVGSALRDLLGEGVPAAIERSLDQLEELDVQDIVPSTLLEVDPIEVLVAALDRLPSRERDVLEARLQPEGPTLQELGDRHHITRERARQIAEKARRLLLQAVEVSDVARAAAGELAQRLGAVADDETVDRELAEVVPTLTRQHGRRRETVRRILLEVAGPYVPWRRGWLIRDGAQGSLDALGERLRKVAPVTAEDELAHLGRLSPSLVDHTNLLDVLGLELFQGHIVRRGSGLQHRAHLVLEGAGQPMKFDRLLALMPDGTHERSFRNSLFADPRIVRRDREEFGLAVWGGEKYTGVADAIRRELERRGGQALISELAEELADRFDVSASSVAAYARSARFVQEGRGLVRLRRPEEQVEEQGLTPLELQRGCVRVDGRWAFRVTVEEKLLTGYSATAPPSFAAHLGAAPLDSIQLPTELDHVISVVRSGLQPSIGRLRPVLEELELGPGALLFVVSPASPRGAIGFHGVDATTLGHADPADRALLELGLDPEAGIQAVARSLDLDAHATVDEVVARLRARREDHIADALSTPTGAVDEVSGGDVADILGL